MKDQLCIIRICRQLVHYSSGLVTRLHLYTYMLSFRHCSRIVAPFSDGASLWSRIFGLNLFLWWNQWFGRIMHLSGPIRSSSLAKISADLVSPLCAAYVPYFVNLSCFFTLLCASRGTRSSRHVATFDSDLEKMWLSISKWSSASRSFDGGLYNWSSLNH